LVKRSLLAGSELDLKGGIGGDVRRCGEEIPTRRELPGSELDLTALKKQWGCMAAVWDDPMVRSEAGGRKWASRAVISNFGAKAPRFTPWRTGPKTVTSAPKGRRWANCGFSLGNLAAFE
jgi:hypothetical protein